MSILDGVLHAVGKLGGQLEWILSITHLMMLADPLPGAINISL